MNNKESLYKRIYYGIEGKNCSSHSHHCSIQKPVIKNRFS